MRKNKLFEKSLSLFVAFVMVFGVFLFFEIPQAAAATIESVNNEADLKTAIEKFNNNNDITDMTINITTSFDITSALTAINNSNNRTLTITSDIGIHTLTFTFPYTVQNQVPVAAYFWISNGKLVFENITVVVYYDNINLIPTDAPIVTVNSGGTLIMNAGATLRNNNSRANGAGVQVNVGGTFIMNDGTIRDNIVRESGGGGGVYVDGGTFTMDSGTISGNTSTGGGGGVNIINGGTFTMDGGTISGNEAGMGGVFSGGGVSVMGTTSVRSKFTMTGGIIKDNFATEDGGGVYIVDSDITIGGNAEISGNTAKRDGGGIIKTAAGVITIGGDARISGNNAGQRSGGVLIGGTGDIIIGGGVVISGNSLTNGTVDNLTLLGLNTFITLGTSGNTPRSGMSVGVSKILDVDETPNESVNVIVQSHALESQAQYFFADAPGYFVFYDAEFLDFENVLRIVPEAETRLITYNANGGSGSMAPGHVIIGRSYTLRANAFTRSGYEFIGWNTAANGSGTGYADGAVLERVNNNITLYAQWWSSNPITVTTENPTWTGTGDVSVSIDADHTRFVNLVLDGGIVPDHNYTVTAGSTIITLKESFLKTLTNNTNKFYATFTDGIAIFELSIDVDDPDDPDDDTDDTPDPDVPGTGDNSNTGIWVALLIISVLGIVGILINTKYRREKLSI
jgi:uncharacterized repeat protein (TIGR02543 family)